MSGLSRALRTALEDPARYEWGDGPWEHLGDAERDVRRLLNEIDILETALLKIIAEAKEHQADVDDLDDTGAHVGYARYESAKADAKAVLAEIAHNALAATASI